MITYRAVDGRVEERAEYGTLVGDKAWARDRLGLLEIQIAVREIEAASLRAALAEVEGK